MYMCVRSGESTHASAHMKRLEDTFLGSGLFFHPVGSEDQSEAK